MRLHEKKLDACCISTSQTLQRDQKAEIARLEQEVHTMRGKHSEAIQKLKSQFLREKRTYQKESDTKIQEMAQQASQVCGYLQVSLLTSSVLRWLPCSAVV